MGGYPCCCTPSYTLVECSTCDGTGFNAPETYHFTISGNTDIGCGGGGDCESMAGNYELLFGDNGGFVPGTTCYWGFTDGVELTVILELYVGEWQLRIQNVEPGCIIYKSSTFAGDPDCLSQFTLTDVPGVLCTTDDTIVYPGPF